MYSDKIKNQAAAFLLRHNFALGADIEGVTRALLNDMESGLNGKIVGPDMIPVFMLPPENPPANRSVIVIDAGGTNFRSCMVHFDAEGRARISDAEKCSMPGVGRELSKKEFFRQIELNIARLKDRADTIAFCFSYPMTITSEHDGIAMAFSKEIKAPEVEGCAVGAELKAALEEEGWTSVRKIVLLNDTQAALLAGAAGPEARKYSSWIGFILGTGMNAAYIEGRALPQKQIVVAESGKFSSLPMSDFDSAVMRKSDNPSAYAFEKQCSGAYLGKIISEMLDRAKEEGILEAPQYMELWQTDGFMAKEGKTPSEQLQFHLMDALFDRTARYSAALLSACAILSGAGRDAQSPVCVLCNGTTFHKTWKIAERVQSYMEDFLTGRLGIHFELVKKEDDITLGTAIAGLSC